MLYALSMVSSNCSFLEIWRLCAIYIFKKSFGLSSEPPFFFHKMVEFCHKRVHPIFFFSERLQPITIVVMCIVAMSVFDPRAFDLESQYSIPVFNKISRLHGQ